MIALRLAGHPTLARTLTDLLVSAGISDPASIRQLSETGDGPLALAAGDILITLPLTRELAGPVKGAPSGKTGTGRWVVVAPAPDLNEALEQIALGADDYVPLRRIDAGVAARLLAQRTSAEAPALEAGRLEMVLSLFDRTELENAQQWSRYLGRVAAFLDVDEIGLWVPGGAARQYRREAGATAPLEELIVLRVGSGQPGEGRLLLARATRRKESLEAVGLLGSIIGRLLSQQLQREDLLSKVLSAKQEWEATADAIQDPIVVLDRQGGVMRANLAFAALVQAPIRSVIDQPVNGLCRLEDSAGWWQTGRPGGAAGPLTLSFPVAPERWFEVHALELGNGREASIVYLRDVTEERRLMSLVMQGERFAALGELAEGIFHDLAGLTTDLQLQLSCARMAFPSLRDEVRSGVKADGSSPEVEEDLALLAESLGNAATAAQRLGQVLNNLRQYSRLRRDTGGERASPIDLNMLIQALPALFSARARERGARIQLELSDIPLACGNASELMRVFENLLKNALDALPKGGEIRLSTSLAGDRIRIEVRDSGQGIPLDLQTRIFERGFTTRQGSGGTGLGLFICRQLLQAHGGTLSVQSQPEQGANFIVELPVLQDEESVA